MAPRSQAVFVATTPSDPAPTPRQRIALAGIALALLLAHGPLGAQSNNVRITKLSDVAFGSPANLEVDATAAQSICVFAHTTASGYRVTAMGSAPGGAFALTSGGALLDYEVQWSETAGQASGAQLSPNVTLGGLVSSATQQTCNNGPATSASLILLLRSTALSSARAGAYAGTLTVLIGPE